ncbi:MAG: LamG domain-containing protein [Candidatus Hydrogenedentes bacterium]|nr:LamG domain-containing protein [Candidatus Hydrogenedentota bacterium]
MGKFPLADRNRLPFVVNVILIAMFTGSVWTSAEEHGLVAYYSFDEGGGSVVRDGSGHGCDGQVHGAQFVSRGKGYGLEFDGIDDYVDCGQPAALDLRRAVTLSAWVYPERRTAGEPGILGKHFNGYLLTYYSDGKCWWYVSSGGNNAKALLTPGSWHHVVGTFDGAALKLHLNGKLVDSRLSAFSEINTARNFFIGCVVGDASATDPAYARTAYFAGQIDEVRVYDRALSADEVSEQFETGARELVVAAEYQPATLVQRVRTKDLWVAITEQGQVQISAAHDLFLIESAYSFPGERIGWNRLTGERRQSDPNWHPKLSRPSRTSLEVDVEEQSYRLHRRITIRGARIEFEDTLVNQRDVPTGFIVRHQLTGEDTFKDSFTPGGAENPTIFLGGKKVNLGIVVEDDVGRLRFEPSLGLPANQARFTIPNFVLDAGKSYTSRWAIYVLQPKTDYFDFMNAVRADWNTNFTIEGPFAFFDVGSPLLQDPPGLRAYLQRKQLKIAALSPWLDYDPGSFNRVWPRDEYKSHMEAAARVLREASPGIKCIGCIETDWVTIHPDRISGGEKLPSYHTGSGLLNAEQTRIIENSGLPWRDSVKRRPDGNLELELYMRGGKPQTALSVYPRVGNYQYEFLMGQVKFLLEEVGLDGFYIDEFSQGWRGGIPSYEGWDGLSAEIDPRTGEIARPYVDCSLAGIAARVNLCKYALDRGKIVVANSYATSLAEQSLPVYRFAETQGSFDPMSIPFGAEPPAVADIFRGNLATPIGLGILGAPQKKDTAQRLMKALITYLRHGALYYHYAIEDIPESGEGGGEYGPINHMFSMTPIALHKGWIEGKERIITAVSGEYRWDHREKPAIHLFDVAGREAAATFDAQREGRNWIVKVRVPDWQAIAVIEAPRRVE